VRSVQQLSRGSKHQQSSKYVLTSPAGVLAISYFSSSTDSFLLPFSSTSHRFSVFTPQQRNQHSARTTSRPFRVCIAPCPRYCCVISRRHTAAASATSYSSRSRHRRRHRPPRPRSALTQLPSITTPQRMRLHFQSLSCELLRFASAAALTDARRILKVRGKLASRNHRNPQLARTAHAARTKAAHLRIEPLTIPAASS
jgi:hypothetical protein